MSRKVIWMITMVYYTREPKNIFPKPEEKDEMILIPHHIRIIGFDKEEAKELIAECNKAHPGAFVEKTKKPQIRGLTAVNLKIVEDLLLKRLNTAIMDLETHPGQTHELEKKIARYREVGRWLFNISDERGRK